MPADARLQWGSIMGDPLSSRRPGSPLDSLRARLGAAGAWLGRAFAAGTRQTAAVFHGLKERPLLLTLPIAALILGLAAGVVVA